MRAKGAEIAPVRVEGGPTLGVEEKQLLCVGGAVPEGVAASGNEPALSCRLGPEDGEEDEAVRVDGAAAGGPRQPELEEGLAGPEHAVPAALVGHVAPHRVLHLVRALHRVVRGPDVGDEEQMIRSSVIEGHLVGEGLLPDADAGIRVDGEAVRVHQLKAADLGEQLQQNANVVARCRSRIQYRGAGAGKEGEELDLGQQQLALAPVRRRLDFPASATIRGPWVAVVQRAREWGR